MFNLPRVPWLEQDSICVQRLGLNTLPKRFLVSDLLKGTSGAPVEKTTTDGPGDQQVKGGLEWASVKRCAWITGDGRGKKG